MDLLSTSSTRFTGILLSKQAENKHIKLAFLNFFKKIVNSSQSFPMVVKSHPDFTQYGAYSKKKVYTAEDIKDIVKFGRSRGVKVIPELDAPAHIGEGLVEKFYYRFILLKF